MFPPEALPGRIPVETAVAARLAAAITPAGVVSRAFKRSGDEFLVR